ncbi:MAG: Type 1 glutamine amidotransferase-like domain-containing protein [Acidimicrobiia bacterium]
MPGTLALIGGGEWSDGCTFDEALLAASGGAEVAVIPAGAAYEHPERALARAALWFEGLGAVVREIPVRTRPEALDPANAARVRDARFTYLCGESPMHLRSVLMHSPVWEALVDAWLGGAVLAGTAAGAMVLCDPMVDPRGGALTLGLGLLPGTAVMPHYDTWSDDKARRTEQIAPAGTRLVGIAERTALIWSPEGGWSSEGVGDVQVHLDGRAGELGDLVPPRAERQPATTP